MEGCKLFIRNSKEGKDRVVYLSDTGAMILRRQLESRSIQSSYHLFPTRNDVLSPRGLHRRLLKRGRECSVSVTAQRLRHTFASQMLATGMPVTSLQRYLGQEDLDTTMLYAEVADPLLQQDYYRGITTLDLATTNPIQPGTKQFLRKEIHQLVDELKTTDLAPHRQREIVVQMQRLLDLIL